MEKLRFENEQEDLSFGERFRKRETVETDGGNVETVDVDLGSNEKVPVFFAGAWATPMNVYESAMEYIAEENEADAGDGYETKGKRRVISMDSARFGGSATAPDKIIEEYPDEEIRKAKAILGVLGKKGVEKTDAIAHSEGAINLVLAALVEPEKFRNLVLFAPAGMIGNDTFTRLLKGFAGQFAGRPESMSTIPVTDTEKKVQKIAGPEGAKYAVKNPLRALKEGIGIADSQIHEALRYLHGKGVGVSIIAGVDDPVFPMNRYQETVKNDMLDGFLSVRGGHGAVGEHPELYIDAAKGLLEAMERKREKDR